MTILAQNKYKFANYLIRQNHNITRFKKEFKVKNKTRHSNYLALKQGISYCKKALGIVYNAIA